jgi:RHS repeat-associated protein
MSNAQMGEENVVIVMAGSSPPTEAASPRRISSISPTDQLLADEQVANGDLLVWALGDNQNTVRDLATYSGGVTTVVNHQVFSAYGDIESQTNPVTNTAAAVNCLFAYTGRPLDKASGLQNNDNRWYNAIIGRWLSQDPIGFGGGDPNLYRYCGNGPIGAVDPNGLLYVNIWYPTGEDSMGHASINLSNYGNAYISWWPQLDRVFDHSLDWLGGLNDLNYTATAFPNQKAKDDLAGEQGRKPDVRIKIDGLDEKAMWEWFQKTKHDDPKWRTLTRNCSTIVVGALEAGGAGAPQDPPPFWTPIGAMQYATQVRDAQQLAAYLAPKLKQATEWLLQAIQ